VTPLRSLITQATRIEGRALLSTTALVPRNRSGSGLHLLTIFLHSHYCVSSVFACHAVTVLLSTVLPVGLVTS
jgi:hypothetical protein